MPRLTPLLFGLASLAAAAPELVPGVWKKVTPAAANVDPANHVFCQGMAIDPRNPSTLYLGKCGYEGTKNVGLYKTVDGGSTWRRVGGRGARGGAWWSRAGVC